MTDHVDDLIDYEEDDVSLLKKPADSLAVPPKKSESTKKHTPSSTSSYTGIHSTGFKEFLLKPELMRAINDCGFEHPSEGISNQFIFSPLIYLSFLLKRTIRLFGFN